MADAPNFQVIYPQEGENRGRNPGFEGALYFGAFGVSDVVQRVTVGESINGHTAETLDGTGALYWRATAKSNVGVWLELAPPKSGVYEDSYYSFYIKPASAAPLPPLTIGVGSANSAILYRQTAELLETNSRGWQRYGVDLTAAQVNGRLYAFIALPATGSYSIECYLDDFQAESGTDPTTWIYGGLGTGFKFVGPADESASTRAEVVDDVPVWDHGRVVDIDDDDTIIAGPISGLGMVQVRHNAMEQGYHPGATLQRVTVDSRQLSVGLVLRQTDTATLHEARAALIDKLMTGPCVFRYIAAGAVVQALVVFKGGFDWGPEVERDGVQRVTLQFVGYDAYFNETSQDVARLAHSSTLGLAYVTGLEDGEWTTPGAAAGSSVGATAKVVYVDHKKALYAGTSVSAGQTATLRRFDGRAWVTLGSFTATSGVCEVRCARLSPDGAKLIVGGRFDAVGALAVKNLAVYTVATATWSNPGGLYYNSGAAATVYALEVDQDNTCLWIGGAFDRSVGTGGVANNLIKFNPTALTWLTLADSPTGAVYCLRRLTPYLYLGGNFSTAGTMTPPVALTVVPEWPSYEANAGYFDSNCIPGDYAYVVTAKTPQGETTASNTVSITGYTGYTGNWLRVFWNKVEGASEYNLYRTSYVGSGSIGTGLVVTTKETSWVDKGYTLTGAPPLSNTAGASSRTAFVSRLNMTTLAFSGVGQSGFNGPVHCLDANADGSRLYAGGLFGVADGQTCVNVAELVGLGWTRMSTAGLPGGTVRGIRVLADGSVVAVGGHTSAGGRASGAYAALWLPGERSGVWHPLSLPFGTEVWSVTERYPGDLVFGHGSAATVTAPGMTTMTNRGSAESWPEFLVIGPGKLVEIVNVSTGQRLVFDYTLSPDEQLRIVTKPSGKEITSDVNGPVTWAMLPGSNFDTFHLRRRKNKLRIGLQNGQAQTRVISYTQTKHLSVDG